MIRLPTEEETAYMTEHMNDSRVRDIIACTVTCGVAAFGILALRLYARLRSAGFLVLNDWLCIATWVFFINFDVCFALSIKYGAGRHRLAHDDAKDTRMFGLLSIAGYNLYALSILFVKLSILSLYDSLFPHAHLRRPLVAVAVLLVCWAVLAVLLTDVQCVPLRVAWSLSGNTEKGWCLDYEAVSVALSSLNVVFDFVILLMPVHLVVRMRPPVTKLVLIVGAFVLGLAACVAGVLRLPYSIQVASTSDPNWDDVPTGIISVVELTLGMLCASFPTYVSFIQPNSAAGPVARDTHNPFVPGEMRTHRSVSVSGAEAVLNWRSGIQVREDIDMVAHTNLDGAWVRVPDDALLSSSSLLPPGSGSNGSGGRTVSHKASNFSESSRTPLRIQASHGSESPLRRAS